MSHPDLFNLKMLKKRIRDHIDHIGEVKGQRKKDELKVSISNLKNKLSYAASNIDWTQFDFSECVFQDLDGRIHELREEDTLRFLGVSHVWLTFDLSGKRIVIDLHQDDFNVDFLDNVKPIEKKITRLAEEI